MNKLFFRLLCTLLLTAFITTVYSQQRYANAPQPVKRCATEEAIQERYRTDPKFKAMMEQRERSFQQWKAAHPNGANTPTTLTGIVTIPVVVHVVLPNPNIITEADIDYFINRLNLDFSGLNPDSTNAVSFYSSRGHSLLRFCLAKRDPSGNFTNGIERRVGAGTIGGGEPQAIKSFASGGLNPWNTSLYYNVWVGVGGGLLGIAPEIGPGTAASDGVCVNYQAFANNACYTIGAFSLARTAVHEIGHNFGLFHTFQGGCGNGDNGQLTTASCVLPGSILSLPDQTPAQSASTSGCPTGNAASGCAASPNPPGKQYQNYMDYTDDACYSMFTNTQVERMHWVTENCRAGYLTSNGCQLPASVVPLDAAAIEIVSPGGSEVIGCNVVTYSVTGCVATFAPKVRVQNQGTTTLTSVTVQFTLNGTPMAPQTFPVNLAYGKSTVVTLASATLVNGANTFSFTVSAPNGGADGNAANNTISGNATYSPPAAVPLPFSQDFVSTTFPPANMTVANPNSNNTWVRNANGIGTVGSAFIDCYNFNLVGQTDDIRTALLTIPGGTADSVILDFDYAHKNFPGFNDRLQVLISSDCGSTFTATGTNPVFDRAGATLATAGSSTANYTAPAATDWQHNRIAIFTGCGSPYATGGNMIVAFRATNGYGNNIFVDNIAVVRKDIILAPTLVQPGCGGGPTGSITINTIAGPVKDYSINGGATWQINNNVFTGLAAGNYNLAIRFQSNPSCVYTYTGNPVTLTGGGSGTPTVNQPANQAVCNAAPTTAVTFSGSVIPNTTYNWTNNTPSIGLAASGAGNIASFNGVNTGNVPVVATITVTPTAPGACPGTPVTFTITVNPTPNVAPNPASQTICSAGAITTIALSGTVTGTTYNWVRNNTASVTGIGASGSGNIAGSLTNTTSAPVTVTFAITPSANGCNGAVTNATVLVNPTPVATATPASQAVCTGNTMTAIVLSSSVTGTTYNWTRTNTANVTGIPASGTGNIVGTPINTTGVAQTVTITITPTANTCPGAAITATIVVNPLPTVSIAAVGPTALTPGQTVNLVATSNPSGGTYVWFNNNVAVAGATSATLAGLTVDNIGIYSTRYTDLNGCVATSGNIELTAKPSSGIWVYPVPNNGIFYVRFYNTLSSPATLNVFDPGGKRVFTKTYALLNPYTRMDVNIRNVQSGYYTVELMQKTGKRINTRKILLLR